MLHAILAVTSVLLNEVLYDPEGADSGREFVELINVSDVPVPLEELVIEAGDGARPGSWQPAWLGAAGVLEPGALLLVGGDSLQSGEKLVADLQNGPDAVRLVRDGAVVDLLGYGALAAAELCEGRPAADVSGRSLARHPDGIDTDDNAADFVPATPTAGRRNAPRRDLALALGEPDPVRAWPGRRIAAALVLRATGLETVPAGSFAIEARVQDEALDSLAARPLAVDFPASLAPGESAAAELAWVGTPGVFRLEARLVPEDENPSNDRASIRVRVGSGPVLVNEILFAPEDGAAEWIELWNRDVVEHDFTGWTLEDGSSRRARLVAGRPLLPGGFAVVSADTTEAIAALEPGTLRIALTPWNALNNTDGEDGFADRLVLRDGAGLVQDALVYSATWSRERGRSLERLVPDPDVRGLLWAACKAAERATPGRANSAALPPSRSPRVDLSPNPFSPDGDGFEELLGAVIDVPEGYEGFRARIFDLEGRCRSLVAADRLGPGPRRFTWDGTADGGAHLPRGIYIMDLEFHSKSSGTFHERRVVGLARP